MTHFVTKLQAGILAGATLLVATPVLAEDFACSTARIVVPFDAGGHSDITARIFETAMNAQGINPPVQVVNISGQSGNVGAKEVVGAAPDGCTLLFTHQSLVSAYLTGRVDFTWSDFEPVARLTTSPVIVSASAEAPFKDLKSLTEYALANPNTVLTGVSLGSTSHFALGTLAEGLGVTFKYVSYDGAAERVAALLGNVIQVTEMTQSSAAQYISSGEMTGLAILSEERSEGLPELQTAVEQGFDVISGNTLGVVLPKGTPASIVEHYEAALRAAVEDPQVQEAVAGRGSVMDFAGAADYAAWWNETFDGWKAVAEVMGVYHSR